MKTIRTHLAAIAAIWAITLGVCLPAISAFGGVSLYDEITHYDYAMKISSGHLPSPVEDLGDEALEEWACRPGDWQPDDFCSLTRSDRTDNDDFPVEGLNYNGFHPPLYYVLSGLGARVISAIASPLADVSTFVAMRIMSAIWLSAGLSFFYLIILRWARPAIAVATTILVGTTPAVASFGMMINPDAMAVMAAAAALFLAYRLSRDKAGLLWGAGLAFLVASTKLLAVGMVLIVAALWVVYVMLDPHSQHKKQALLTFGGTLIGTIASIGVARLLTGPDLGIANPVTGLSTTAVGGRIIDPLAMTVAQNYSLTTPYWMVDGVDSTFWGASARLFGIALVAAPLIALWHYRPVDAEHKVACSAVIGALAIPLIIQVREILAHGEFFEALASRYSLTVIPVAAASLAFLATQRKAGSVSIVCASTVSALVALGTVLT